MAYSAPAHDAVNFNFSRDGYSAPAPAAVNFNFQAVEVYLRLGSRWNVESLGTGVARLGTACAVAAVQSAAVRLGTAWAVDVPTQAVLRLSSSYAIERAPADTLVLGSRYAVAAPQRPIVHLGGRYAVRSFSSAAVRLGTGYAVAAPRAGTCHFGSRWLVLGAPAQVLFFGARWACVAPGHAEARLGAAYAVAAPAESLAFLGSRWAVAVPAYAEIDFGSSWYFRHMVARALVVSYPYQVRKALAVPLPLGRTPVRNALVVSGPLYTRVARSLEIAYGIVAFDAVAKALWLRGSILDGAVIVAPAPPVLTVAGRTVKLAEIEVSAEEGQYAWSCRATLHDPQELELFAEDAAFSATLGGETYAFLRNDARLARGEGPVAVQAVVTGLSPSCRHAEPRGGKITKTWDAAILVSDLLAELFGADAPELRGVLDWSIPAGRLSVSGQTPVAIAQTVARASGALLESDPDGTLYLRPAWPVPVPFLDTVEPDHVFDDARDAFTLEERRSLARIENRIRIVDAEAGASGLLAAEIDAREDGYNAGRTSFAPGDQPAILVFRSERVDLDAVRPSAGNIAPLAGGTMEVEETLDFADTTEATLRYPTAALTSSKWLGNDLGAPALADELTVRIAAAGVGRLLVTYDTAFDARRLSGVPVVLNGETDYDVLVLVEGTQR